MKSSGLSFWGNKNWTLKLILLWLMFSCLGILSCQNSFSEVLVKNGVLDLSQWDFDRQDSLELNGQWKFKWREDDLRFAQPDFPDHSWPLLKVPSYWNKELQEGHGFGWYRARVRVKPGNYELGLFLSRIKTSYQLYVNGRLKAANGTPGNSASTTVPNYTPRLIPLKVSGPEILIALRVANFHHNLGGLHKAPRLGKLTTIQHQLWLNDLADFAVLGVLLVMGLYHLILWAGRSSSKESLWFALLCLDISIRHLTVTFMLPRMFTQSNLLELNWTLDYMSISVGVICLLMFIHTLFPREASPKWQKLFVGAGLLLTIMVMFTKTPFFSKFLFLFQILSAATVILCFWVTCLAAKRKRQESRLVLTGLIIFLLTVGNDILFASQIIDTGFLFSFGLVLFIFFQASVISLRFSRSFQTVEHLTHNLQQEVEKQTDELSQSNQCLQEEIHERRRAEEAVRESERRLHSIFSNLQAGIILVDPENRQIVETNQVAAKLIGAKEEEINGSLYNQYFSLPEGEQSESVPDNQLIANQEVILLNSKGEKLDILKTAVPLSLDGKMYLLESFIDISHRKVTQDEYLKVQKLESIGLMAEGIANQFNNQLQAILGNIQYSKMHFQPGEELFDALTDSERAALIAKDLTGQLLSFARISKDNKEKIWLPDILEQVSTQVLKGTDCTRFFSLADDLWQVEADKDKIKQMIEIVITNSVQAMPQGGEILIRAENKIGGQGDTSNLIRPGNYVKISIQDQGTGIPEKFIRKIFDPYFTTKQRGSGLGLSIAFSIARNYGGYIFAESVPNQHTIITIWLLAYDDSVFIEPQKMVKPKPEKAEPDQPDDLSGMNVRILFMDDDEMVRNFAGRVLNRFGYQVELASDGGEAIELYQKYFQKGEPFTVDCLDLTVPGGIGGQQAMEEILKVDPSAMVLVMSGYSDDTVMLNYSKYGFKGVIHKPFKVEDIEAALKQVRNR